MDANSGATVASLSQQVEVELVQEDICSRGTFGCSECCCSALVAAMSWY